MLSHQTVSSDDAFLHKRSANNANVIIFGRLHLYGRFRILSIQSALSYLELFYPETLLCGQNFQERKSLLRQNEWCYSGYPEEISKVPTVPDKRGLTVCAKPLKDEVCQFPRHHWTA